MALTQEVFRRKAALLSATISAGPGTHETPQAWLERIEELGEELLTPDDTVGSSLARSAAYTSALETLMDHNSGIRRPRHLPPNIVTVDSVERAKAEAQADIERTAAKNQAVIKAVSTALLSASAAVASGGSFAAFLPALRIVAEEITRSLATDPPEA